MKIYSFIIAAFTLLVWTSCQPKHLRINTEASLHPGDQLPENPLLMHPFTTTIYPKDSLMSTLYGNDTAFQYALKNTDGHYPNGSILYEVTWREQPDSQWFGANIPQKIVRVERLQFQNNQSHYSKYEGIPLTPVADSVDNPKTKIIVAQRMAMIP
ncbi:MAG: hypothetical protein PW786_04570 [Arachidicoccus sp.]|nr:hypothetical protein [Arachidicoccus sp.]